jgi:hypothetical protein
MSLPNDGSCTISRTTQARCLLKLHGVCLQLQRCGQATSRQPMLLLLAPPPRLPLRARQPDMCGCRCGCNSGEMHDMHLYQCSRERWR